MLCRKRFTPSGLIAGKSLRRWLLSCVLVVVASDARAQLWINELYFDPPGSAGDLAFEYIELRGTHGASLSDTVVHHPK